MKWQLPFHVGQPAIVFEARQDILVLWEICFWLWRRLLTDVHYHLNMDNWDVKNLPLNCIFWKRDNPLHIHKLIKQLYFHINPPKNVLWFTKITTADDYFYTSPIYLDKYFQSNIIQTTFIHNKRCGKIENCVFAI